MSSAVLLSACDNTQDASSPNAGETTQVTTPAETSASSDSTTTSPSDPTPTTSEPSASTASSSPTPTTHDNSPTRRAKQAQVPAAALPGFNTEWIWDNARGRAGVRPVSPGSSRCLRASLTAIGGVVEYSTAYTAQGDAEDEAIVTTAVFPDEHTATMAESVLATWQRTCRGYLAQQPGVGRVGQTVDRVVQTVVGPAHSRLLSFGPVKGDRDATYFNGEGYVRDGDVISYLVVHNAGQDYNYTVAQEPVVRGLKVAARYLKKSR